MPQLKLAMASGRLYNLRWERRSTTNSIPIRMKKTGMERTIGFRFNLLCGYLAPSKVINMALKIFKGIWFLSAAAFIFFFLYGYASLPENVLLSDSIPVISVSRDAFFYLFFTFVALLNASVFAIPRLYAGNGLFITWFFGLIILLNCFFLVVAGFVSVFNSGENFNYERLGLIIYGSLILIFLWVASHPVYLFYQKIFHKQKV